MSHNTLIEAARAALAALETCTPGDYSTGHVIRPSYDAALCAEAEGALRAALVAAERPAGEPVAWQCREHGDDEWSPCSREGFGANPGRYVYRALYAVPPAPLDAIGRVLAEVMDAAVRNGANSVSMPDHYVEVAAWLAKASSAPAATPAAGPAGAACGPSTSAAPSGDAARG